MFFSVITKNLNWRKLTKNYLLLKSGIKGQGWKILILWGFTEKSFFFSLFFFGGEGEGGFTKNQYIVGNCLKMWGLGSWQICGSFAKKRRGGVFEGELIPQCTLCNIKEWSPIRGLFVKPKTLNLLDKCFISWIFSANESIYKLIYGFRMEHAFMIQTLSNDLFKVNFVEKMAFFSLQCYFMVPFYGTW